MTLIAFVDLETTGIDPAVHDVWEIGIIDRRPFRVVHPGRPDTHELRDTEYHWFVEPDLAAADPGALRIGRYYERTCSFRDRPAGGWSDPAEVAHEIAVLTDGAAVVAVNPAFDTGFLSRFLRANGQCPAWDYHLIDIGSLVRGWMAGARPGVEVEWPLGCNPAARLAGVDPGLYALHTAVGDARLARDVFDKVTGGAS